MQDTATRRASRLLLTLSLGLTTAGAASCTFSSDDQGGFSFRISANSWNLRHHATEERRQALDVQAGETLVLEGFDGDVLVRASAGGPGELIGLLAADGRTAEEAEEALAAVRIEVERAGAEVRVGLRSDAREIEVDQGVTISLRPRVDVRATIPHGVRIRVRDTSGEIEVEGPVADVEARTSYGAVRLAHVAGSAQAASGSGRIVIRDVRGGDVSADTNFGDVTLEDVEGGAVEAESSSGDLVLRAVTAERISARSSFGGVELEQVAAADVTAETASGDIELRDGARGAYRLHSNFGTVSADRVAGVVRATSDSGDVAVGADGDVEATSGFGRVTVEGVLTRVIATSDSGDVEVTARAASAPAEEWRITSRFGKLVLRVPEGFACAIDARTEFGGVEDEFGLDADEEGSGSRATGTLGAGGRAVVLRTSSGDIVIRRGR